MHNQGLIPYYKYLIYRYGSQYIIDLFRDQKFPIHKEDGEFGFDFFAIMAADHELFDCYSGKNFDAERDAYRSFENKVREDILTMIRIMKIDKIQRNLYS